MKTSLLQQTYQYVETEDLIIIKKLRDYWKQDMTPENKEKVWSYLTNTEINQYDSQKWI